MKAVPFIDLRRDGPAALARAHWGAANELLDIAERRFTRMGLRIADRRSRAWLARTANPFLAEIDAIASALDRPGVHALNLSFEWGCTTGVFADPASGLPRMLRTLDWPLAGLGRNLVVVNRASEHGRLLDASWPGAVGMLTVLAPGRFAAAINQAPMAESTLGRLARPVGLGKAFDWIAQRITIGERDGLPPAHLLRHVAQTAPDYQAAKRMLSETALPIRCIFVLAGVRAGEGCVIERIEDRAAVHEMPDAVAANGWRAREPGFDGAPRTRNSAERLAALSASGQRARAPLDWLTPPVRWHETRLAAELCPASGRMLLQGHEAEGPATAVFDSEAVG
jgi:hypothetical protein